MLKLKDLKPSEKEITREIRAYLDIKGIPHFKKLQGLGSPKGIADIIGCLQIGRIGVMMCIEVKREGKEPSFDQELFLMKYKQVGALTFVARNVEDVEREINAYKKLFNLWEGDKR